MSEHPAAGEQDLLRTPLHPEHVRLGAHMVPFGGWHMPVDYGSIIEEHHATRQAAGLFDLSHMGEFSVSGPGAHDLVCTLVTNDPDLLAPGQGQYSPMCQDDGTIVDDIILYHLPGPAPARYLLVVNAANIAKDWAWVHRVASEEGLSGQVTLEDRSAETALIALQGPHAATILSSVVEEPLSTLGSFAIREATVGGVPCLIARTGYTGEDGFEILVANEHAGVLWNLLLARGQDAGVRTVGLGARDTLRLEARLPLYGNDISDATTPLEAGLQRFVKLQTSFRGKDALVRQKSTGPRRKLVGLEMDDRSIPRAHYPVLQDGVQLGEVTSGSFSPTLGKGIALAYLPIEQSAVGTKVQILVRGQARPATVVKTPFYRRSS